MSTTNVSEILGATFYFNSKVTIAVYVSYEFEIILDNIRYKTSPDTYLLVRYFPKPGHFYFIFYVEIQLEVLVAF